MPGARLISGAAACSDEQRPESRAKQQVEWLTLNDETGAITDANDDAVRGRFTNIGHTLAGFELPEAATPGARSRGRARRGWAGPSW